MDHIRLHKNDIKRAIKSLKNNKAHGSDGIPGEVYKTLRKHTTTPITEIMNEIKMAKTYQKNG